MAVVYQVFTPGVYIKELPSGSSPIQGVNTAVAAFLGVTEQVPDELIGKPVLVTSWTQYKDTFGNFNGGSLPLPHSVHGYFLNGGGVAYVMSLGAANTFPPVEAKRALALPSRAPGGAPTLELTPKVESSVKVTVEDDGADAFKIRLEADGKQESFDGLTFEEKPSGGRKAAVKTLQGSKLVNVKELPSTDAIELRRPAAGNYEIAAIGVMHAAVPSVKQIQGNLEDRVGLEALEAISDITMICMPDIMVWQKEGRISLEDAQGLQLALINHCHGMFEKSSSPRMAILDAPAGMKPQRVKTWRKSEANYDSMFAALYYPWIEIQNPAGKGRISMPPSAYVAGLYARVDGERGVHKAPANEVLRGAVALEIEITDAEQGQLNPDGINCIRSFPGRGIRVWGARTLSSDMNWNYINVRRLFNYVERSIFDGTQWVVFEPNDMDLWERVKRTVTAFLTNVWRSGALFGATPEQAFYVKCDEELNPQATRDLGMLLVEVGLAPVKPAEFVVFQFKQMKDGDSAA